MVCRLLSNHYCLTHQAALRKAIHISVSWCSAVYHAIPVLCKTCLACREDTQKMTRRLKRRYEEIHHTAPVSLNRLAMTLFASRQARDCKHTLKKACTVWLIALLVAECWRVGSTWSTSRKGTPRKDEGQEHSGMHGMCKIWCTVPQHNASWAHSCCTGCWVGSIWHWHMVLLTISWAICFWEEAVHLWIHFKVLQEEEDTGQASSKNTLAASARRWDLPLTWVWLLSWRLCYFTTNCSFRGRFTSPHTTRPYTKWLSEACYNAIPVSTVR